MSKVIQIAATLLASNFGAGDLPNSTGFTLSFLMRLGALVDALAFAIWVPRRGVNEPQEEPQHLRGLESAEPGRAAAA